VVTDLEPRARDLLRRFPLVDGHNGTLDVTVARLRDRSRLPRPAEDCLRAGQW
jgi:hypothetical protein